MTKSEYELRNKEITDFRYSVVAELGNPYLPRGQLIRMIQEKAAREYRIPYSRKTQVSEACIRRWLWLYRKYGKQGLEPKIRDDFGKSRIINDAEQTEILELLKSRPELTAIAAVRKLQKQGVITSDISSSSLSRFIKAQGMTANQRWEEKQKEKSLKFDFFSPLECVQVDVMYGPEIPCKDGKKRKALLMAFLDDATRRIIYANFSFSEKSILFEDGIKHILKAQGMLGKIYTDNGSSFISQQTNRILDILGITLTHSKPGRPQGRGKCERFFRTTRDQFIRPLDIDDVKDLDHLNALFRTWLECEYHRSPHRGLQNKMTPLDAWMAKAHHIKPLSPSIDLDRVFLHMANRKVFKDSTFTLSGSLFEAPAVLAGKRITIYFDPHPPVRKVLVFQGGKEYGYSTIVDTYANTKVKRSYSTPKNLEIENSQDEYPVNLTATDMGDGYHEYS